MSPEPPDRSAGWAREKGIEYPVLSDPSFAVMKLFGVVNKQRPSLPHPAAFVIDRHGIVRHKRIDVDYTKRPESVELLDVLRNLVPAPTQAPEAKP